MEEMSREKGDRKMKEMRDMLVEELRECQEALGRAIEFIENRSISKTELLLHLQDLNKVPENVPAVRSFYYKFFKKEEEEHEPVQKL